MGFIAYAMQRGVEPVTLCNDAGIDLHVLRSGNDLEIGDISLQRLWESAVRLTGDNLFGLHFGESFQLAALGAVGEIIKSSDTVGTALKIASGFTPVVSTLFVMSVERDADYVSVVFRKTREEDPEISRQIADFLMVFTVHELRGLLLTKINPASIRYPFDLRSKSEYGRILSVTPVRSDSEMKIFFPSAVWDEPIITANYEVQNFFLQRIASSNVSADTASFQAKVMDHLLKNAYHGLATLDDVAANFNMTPRSLQRRLQEEGTTFQQTVDSIRKTLALHYLESGNYKIKEISTLLGYNEISAFSRAFKRWTGKPPVIYSA